MVEATGFIKGDTFPLMRYEEPSEFDSQQHQTWWNKLVEQEEPKDEVAEEAKARVSTLLGRLDVLLSVDIW